MSGPCIAGEPARKLPATMVVATEKQEVGSQKPEGEDLARWVQELFTTAYLRVYRNDDLLGVELAGALKNVIAIAAGILDGMGAGNNAKAAPLTRGLVEITRLGVAVGAQAETFAGLAGTGGPGDDVREPGGAEPELWRKDWAGREAGGGAGEDGGGGGGDADV